MKNKNEINSVKSCWPDSGLESVPSCPICESKRRELFYDKLTDRVFFCAPGTWSLYLCKDCKCAYLDPRPSSNTIGLAYRRYYTHAGDDEDRTKTLRGLGCLRRSLANGYRNWRFASNFQPANRLGVVAAIVLPSLKQRLDQGLRNVPRLQADAHLLDVGFGDGAFLELARSAGWDVTGVDPDPVSVESAIQRGFDVRLGGIEACADRSGSFDAVTLSHVIEHVHDPIALLQSAYHLLKPGGFLWLSTPNIESLGLSIYGRNWLGLDPPRHLVLFRWQAIQELLRKMGFDEVQKEAGNFVYARVAAQSEAVAKGIDPYSFTKLPLRYHVAAFIARGKLWLHPHRTEFITCQALKPTT